MLNIDNTIHNTIAKFKMFEKNKKILIGVSGGADSMCLLHFLNRYKKMYNISIFVVHINHGVRGDEANYDEEFVKNFCKNIDIPFYAENIDLPQIALENKMGLEECGRILRYKIFNNLSKKLDSKIATAHTLSDSIETIFLNILRGCTINGICGIPPVRDKIVRPLIDVSREEIENYCKTYGLEFVTDSTNLLTDYKRNKIRLKLIPILRDINPSYSKCFLRFFKSVTEDKNYLEKISDIEYNKTLTDNINNCHDIKFVRRLPEGIKRRVIYKVLENLSNSRDIEYKHIDLLSNMIKKSENGSVTLRGNVKICLYNDTLYKENVFSSDEKKNFIDWEYPLSNINFLTLLGTTFIIKIVSIREFRILVNEGNKYIVGTLDFDKIPEGSIFRNRREHDIFVLKRRGVTKSIKKLFNELKIPVSQRYRIPMLAYENRIIWIYGVGEDEYYSIDENTKNVVLILEGENIDEK